MYVGELYLSYEDEDVEDHYCADISRFSLVDGLMHFEFSGASEGHKFTGRARLEKKKGNASLAQASLKNTIKTPSNQMSL